MNPKPPQIELIPLKTGISLTQPTHLDVLLRIHSPQPEAKPDRPLMNLALVLDRSGSMQGDKLAYAKQAAIYAVQNLLPEDRVAVVMYDDKVEVLVPNSPASHRQAIIERIQSIQAGGSTALHAGWLEGATQVATFQEPGRLNRVILLSDGLANQGETNTDVIATQVKGLAGRKVSTSTLGVGLDYNEDLMAAMADAGEGNYYFIESPADLPRIFTQELSGLSNTFGTRVRLQITAASGVAAQLANTLEQEVSGAYILPNLIAGLPTELLVRLVIPAGQGSPVNFNLSWETPGSGAVQSLSMALTLTVLSDAEFERLLPNPEVAAMGAKLEATQARQMAMEALARGDIDAAKASIAAAMPAVAGHAQYLKKEQAELEGLLQEVDQAPAKARKTMSSQVYRNRKGSKES